MILEDYFTSSIAVADMWEVAVAVILSAVLGLALSQIYKKYGRSLSNRSKFGMLFPAIAMTTALIIAIVKSSLALSLGLVGALSIIRFRTAIKEPEELAYLFLAISVGLGMGASLYSITIMAFVIISGVIIFMSFGPKNQLGINFVIKTQALKIDDITGILNEHKCKYLLRRSDQAGDTGEFAFFIDSIKTETLSDISKKISGLDSDAKISYYEAQVGI